MMFIRRTILFVFLFLLIGLPAVAQDSDDHWLGEYTQQEHFPSKLKVAKIRKIGEGKYTVQMYGYNWVLKPRGKFLYAVIYLSPDQILAEKLSITTRFGTFAMTRPIAQAAANQKAIKRSLVLGIANGGDSLSEASELQANTIHFRNEIIRSTTFADPIFTMMWDRKIDDKAITEASWHRLFDERYSDRVLKALQYHNAAAPSVFLQFLQPNNPVNYDDFYVDVYTEKPQVIHDFFATMKTGLDKAASIGATESQFLLRFQRIAKLPSSSSRSFDIGDILYPVASKNSPDILKLGNLRELNVMLTDIQETSKGGYIRYSTLTNKTDGHHAVHVLNGSREYGYNYLGGGRYRIYIRGVDQWNVSTPLGALALNDGGTIYQQLAWRSWTQAVQTKLRKQGLNVGGINSSNVHSAKNLPASYQKPSNSLAVYAAPQE